jgi:hypothetical protein
MSADADEEQNQCLNGHYLIGVEETGLGESLLNPKTILLG